MRTFELGPSDFPLEHELRLWRVTFPPGHFMTENPAAPEVRFYTRPYTPHPEAPESLDSCVEQEEILIRYTRVLNGGPGEAQLVQPTRWRIRRHLEIGKDCREV